MISALGKELRQSEAQSKVRFKLFARGVKKIGPGTDGLENWDSSDIPIPKLGIFRTHISIPRDEHAVEESAEWKDNQPVFVVDKNGEVSEGTSNDYLENYGSLWVCLSPPNNIFQELQERQNLTGKKVPKINVDVLVWISEGSRFRGKIEDILGQDFVFKFTLEGLEGKPKPVLFAADEELLKKIGVSFETYTEPPKKGEVDGN